MVHVIAGYSGGQQRDPTYDEVLDHSEALWIEYDPSQITLEVLLLAWTKMHKPGKHVVSQYRSAVWHLNEYQRVAAERVVAEWNAQYRERFDGRDSTLVLCTTVEPATAFYKAEPYHQDYYIRTGQARFVR